MTSDPHSSQPVVMAGASVDQSRTAMVLVHGRGHSPEKILELVPELDVTDYRYAAPAAEGGSWYPNSFLEPVESNEPRLSSGLAAIGSLLSRLEDEGFSADRTILLGFSQGACLVLEYALLNPRRYGGIVGLTGGVITDAAPRERREPLADTPVFLGCSDNDPFIPRDRVYESADLFRELGARVTTLVYPGSEHVISDPEIGFVRSMMLSLDHPPGGDSRG